MRALFFLLMAGCGVTPLNKSTTDTEDSGIDLDIPEDSFMLGELAIAPQQLNFGTILVGNVESQTVNLINTGADTLSIASINIEGDSSFALQTSFSPFDLDAGGEEIVQVEFNPASAADFSATMSVLISTESSKGEIDMQGVGTLDEDETGTETDTETETSNDDGLELAQTSYDFGNVAMNQTKSQSISIVNNSNEDITVNDITISDQNFTISPASNVQIGEVIEAGLTQAITVSFTPLEEKEYSGTVTIKSDSAQTPSLDLDVTGTGSCATCAPAIYVLSDNVFAAVANIQIDRFDP